MIDRITPALGMLFMVAACVHIAVPIVKYDETSDDGLRMTLHTGSALDIWSKCAEFDSMPPFDENEPQVCIRFDERHRVCDVYSPDPVSDKEWRNERHMCQQLAKQHIGIQT
jgi:hypothetical protein